MAAEVPGSLAGDPRCRQQARPGKGPAGGSGASPPGPLNATPLTHCHPSQAVPSTRSLNQAVLAFAASCLLDALRDGTPAAPDVAEFPSDGKNRTALLLA